MISYELHITWQRRYETTSGKRYIHEDSDKKAIKKAKKIIEKMDDGYSPEREAGWVVVPESLKLFRVERTEVEIRLPLDI